MSAPEKDTKETAWDTFYAAMGKALHQFATTDSNLTICVSYLIPTDVEAAGIIYFGPKNIDSRLELVANLMEHRFSRRSGDKLTDECADALIDIFEQIETKIRRQRHSRNLIAHGNPVEEKSPTGKVQIRLQPTAFDYLEEKRYQHAGPTFQFTGLSIDEIKQAAKKCQTVNNGTSKLFLILQDVVRGGFQEKTRAAIHELAAEWHVPIPRPPETPKPPETELPC